MGTPHSFSFWISLALAKICFFCILVNYANVPQSVLCAEATVQLSRQQKTQLHVNQMQEALGESDIHKKTNFVPVAV